MRSIWIWMKLSRCAPPPVPAVAEAGQPAASIARRREDRMHDEADVDALLGELPHAPSRPGTACRH